MNFFLYLDNDIEIIFEKVKCKIYVYSINHLMKNGNILYMNFSNFKIFVLKNL